MCPIIVETREELCRLLEEKGSEYSIVHGKNSEGMETFSEATRLVIIGTAIPEGLDFFYIGANNKIYQYIDAIKPNLGLTVLAKEKRVEELKARLKELGIVFLDITNEYCAKKGSSKEKDIKGLIVDDLNIQRVLDAMKTNPRLRIVPASGMARDILKRRYNLGDLQLCSLITPYYQKEWQAKWFRLLQTIL